VDLGGPRQRVVLAMLALNANRVTTVDQIIDAIWDTSPPSTARAQIQTCVSGLRKMIGARGHPGAIRTRPAGYQLEIALEHLDTEVFASLLDSAREQTEQGRLAEAATTRGQRSGYGAGPHSPVCQAIWCSAGPRCSKSAGSPQWRSACGWTWHSAAMS
jgi:DNA-binding SARP family transcriptional activator